jgi:hypothetical protein
MSNYRGQTGLLVLGGKLQGAPLVAGAVASAAATVTVDGSVLVGVLAVGDIFEVDGDGISRTVTGSVVRVASTNVVSAITFTPSATAGFGNNATVTFTSNSIAELTVWSLGPVEQELIEDTAKGDTTRTYKGGYVNWSGTGGVLLDYGDTKQAELIDMITGGTADGTIATLVFVVEEGEVGELKMLYGAAYLTSFTVNSPEGSSIVDASFNFQGRGDLSTNWNTV